MSTTYIFHPAIHFGACLEFLIDHGYEVHRGNADGTTSPIPIREALTLKTVALKDKGLGRPNFLWVRLGTVGDATTRLIDLTRYGGNASSPTLDLIESHSGPRHYIFAEGEEPAELTMVHHARGDGDSFVTYWRNTPPLAYPGDYSSESLEELLEVGEDLLEGFEDPNHRAACERYRSEYAQWLETQLRPEDYLVADLDSRRVTPPVALEWATISREESEVGGACVSWLLHLRRTSSIVLPGEEPLDWQRDEHDMLIDRFRSDYAKSGRKFLAMLKVRRGDEHTGSAAASGP